MAILFYCCPSIARRHTVVGKVAPIFPVTAAQAATPPARTSTHTATVGTRFERPAVATHTRRTPGEFAARACRRARRVRGSGSAEIAIEKFGAAARWDKRRLARHGARGPVSRRSMPWGVSERWILSHRSSLRLGGLTCACRLAPRRSVSHLLSSPLVGSLSPCRCLPPRSLPRSRPPSSRR